MSDPARLAAIVRARTIALSQIPAPPLHEAARAEVVARWWTDDGLAVHTDDTGNVWARVRDGRADDAVAVCAHLDTVFPADVPHGATVDGDLLRGPGVGDDTVAVAALSTLDALLGDTDAAVWLLATVGEEGLGDLVGARAALARPPQPLRALIAVEGNYLGRICHIAVGSQRYRVTFMGPGGHAWERADAPSAVHAAAEFVATLAAHAAPAARPRRTVNAGHIAGGDAINARAARCEVAVDLRSDDADALADLDATLRRLAHGVADSAGLDVVLTSLGARPAGRLAPDHPLVRTAVSALEQVGITPALIAASTDANAAHPHGVPALAIGVTHGAGEHTPDEWITLSPLPVGLRALALTVQGAADARSST